MIIEDCGFEVRFRFHAIRAMFSSVKEVPLMRNFALPLVLPVFLSALSMATPSRAGGPSFRTGVGLPLLRAIDGELRGGALTLERAISLRDLAVKRPWDLEEPWRDRFAREPLPAWAATAVLIENQQWRMQAGLASHQYSRADYTFPQELPFYIDSESFPIRVYYPDATYAGLAQGVLAAADLSWQKEVSEWGFYEPPLVTPEGLYRIYLGNAGPGVNGYMDPFDRYPEVDRDACVSYVLIDVGNSADGVGPVVAHELNHAMQASMDCLEQLAFFENTSTFVMAPVYPDYGLIDQNGFLSAFQSEPFKSVSRGASGELFMYGGFLWPHFLAYTYEDEAGGPIFVRRAWEGAVQSSGSNSIDYMRSIDALLRADYGTDLNAAFEAFTVARFFLDERAGSPLATIRNAVGYASNPDVAGTISVDWVTARTPTEGTRPEGYSANYWALVAPSGFAREVSIALDSEAAGPWVLLLFSADDDEVLRAEAVAGEARLTYTPTAGEERFLAVVRTGGDGFDPAEIPAEAAYSLSIGPTVPAPEIDAVTPASTAQGAAVAAEIDGASFQDGVQVACSPAGIAVGAVTFVDDATLEVDLAAAVDAPIGRYSITVTNPDGGAVTLYSALEVTAPTEIGGESSAAEGDCGCRAAGALSAAGLLALLSIAI
jgi:hypothetical protein